MTGSSFTTITTLWNHAMGHAQFAASRAPNSDSWGVVDKLLYGLMGATCSLAFELGSKFRSLAFQKTTRTNTDHKYFKEILSTKMMSHNDNNGSSNNSNNIMSSGFDDGDGGSGGGNHHHHQSSSFTDGLVVVIPALVKTMEGVQILQDTIDILLIGSSKSAVVKTMVIIVDDESPLILEESLQLSVPDGTDFCCIVVRHLQNLGPAAARNTGIRLALELGALVIGFTDADCQPDSEWAKTHWDLQKMDPGIWAGRTVAAAVAAPDHDDDDSEKLSMMMKLSRFHDRVGTLMPRLRTSVATDALYAPTCNLSISRKVAETIQFDERFPTSAFEDVDFCLRARKLYGFEVKVSDKPLIKHWFEPGWLGLIRSYHKYGRSYPLLLECHPDYPQELHHSVPMSAILCHPPGVNRLS